jgi:peptide/nickel transport system substrate-binding protein
VIRRARGPVLARTAVLVAVLALGGCVRELPRAPEGVLVVSQEQQASWVRNFNPLTTATAARWPTLAGVYEPLLVFDSVRSEYLPWLAVDHAWREGNRVLRVTTRSGVLWSDGEPFTARDVAFTFNLLHRFPALDRRGVWGFLESVEARNDSTVDFHFQRVFIPGFDEVAAQQIVPEHVWKDVADPVTFANENPVATGPFTEVRVFRNQVYELGRNPHYWQPGLPKVQALRFPAYPSNDRANMALVFDEVDWAGNFIPAVKRVYVERNPADHHYWFPLTGSTIFLYANTTRAPFEDVRVRKALSMAIDRDLLVDVALYRYSRPADATGLSDAYASWRDSTAVAEGTWVHHDIASADSLLDAAGFPRGADGIRRLPDGSPWRYDILTVSGWSDWVRATQVIARGLGDVGIEASVKTYDFSAWFQRVQEGNFDLSLGWSFEGPTPYPFYRWLMSSATVKPVREASMGNWQRYGSAAADSALAAFEREADPAGQRRLAATLERIFVAQAPAIPLYPNPSWAEYNTSRFEGFPSKADPYADPSPNKFDRGETLLVLTTLAPR